MMRLSYITCPLLESNGILEISLIIRDYHDNDNKFADEIKMSWDRTVKADVWSDPAIEINNLVYDNSEHASKMLGMLYRLIEKGTKTNECDPCSILTEMSRKNFRQIVFDKRVDKYLIKQRVKSGKGKMYSLPEKFDMPITVEASNVKSAIGKITKEFTEAGMENIERLDTMKLWFEDDFPLDKLSEEDVPQLHNQKHYNASIRLEKEELAELIKKSDEADELEEEVLEEKEKQAAVKS